MEWWNLESDIPTDFKDVPLVNNMHSWFFHWEKVSSVQMKFLTSGVLLAKSKESPLIISHPKFSTVV